MDWPTCWAIFLKTHLVTLDGTCFSTWPGGGWADAIKPSRKAKLEFYNCDFVR
jgi:hypothetical protein